MESRACRNHGLCMNAMQIHVAIHRSFRVIAGVASPGGEIVCHHGDLHNIETTPCKSNYRYDPKVISIHGYVYVQVTVHL